MTTPGYSLLDDFQTQFLYSLIRKIATAVLAAAVFFAGISYLDTKISSATPNKSSLQQQADQLSAEILAQSSQLHQLVVKQAASQENLSQAQSAVAQSEALLGSDETTLKAAEGKLSTAAINEFVNQVGTQGTGSFFNSSIQNAMLRSDFASVATTNISDYLLEVKLDQSKVQTAQTILQSNLSQAQAALNSVEASKSYIASEISSEQNTLSSINGQIQNLVQLALQAQLAQRATLKRATSQRGTSGQGLPSASGIKSVIADAGVGNGWGGVPAPLDSATLAALRGCESGGNYQDNTGNGYYGAYQFSASTWHALGYSGLPSQFSPSVQDQAASVLQQRYGWGQWPACSMMLGLI